MEDILATCIVLSAGEMGNAGVIVEVQGLLLGMGVMVGAGVAESALSNCWEPSCSEGGQDPGVTHSNLLGVVSPGLGLKCQAWAHDRRSCISVVMLVAASWGYFTVGCIKEGGSEDVRGIKAMGASLLGFTLDRLTHRSNISWWGLLSVGSGKVNHMGSNSHIQTFGAYHLIPIL